VDSAAACGRRGAADTARPYRPRSTGTDPGTEEDTVKVDIATLQAMAAQCRGEAGEQSARLATLSAAVGTGVTDGWTDSAAAVQFSNLYEQWRLSSQTISTALSGMGDLLTDVGNAYQQHEAQMAARIGAMV